MSSMRPGKALDRSFRTGVESLVYVKSAIGPDLGANYIYPVVDPCIVSLVMEILGLRV